MYEFKLPDIGEGLHEAELLEWDVKVGDKVGEGDSIAQVSTDKVNVELPSPCAGVVAELPWKPGDVIPVGEVLARIDDGRGAAAAPPGQKAGSEEQDASRPPEVQRQPRIKATPAVRRYAAEKGVELADVAASAPGGAVSREDIDAHLAAGADNEGLDGGPGVTRLKLSGSRLAAARRLEQSWRTLATSAMTFEVEADGVKAGLQSFSSDTDSAKITPLALIAACVCAALEEHRNFNAVIDEEARALEVHDAIHLGIAVDGPDGLLVPVIRNAGDKTVPELAEAIADRAEGARSGKLQVADFQGSTFTISSTGSLEEATITATTPVINYPNLATLWVSRMRDRPRVVDGKIGAGPMMNCTLAFDHRFVHGADATRFINTLARLMQNPG